MLEAARTCGSTAFPPRPDRTEVSGDTREGERKGMREQLLHLGRGLRNMGLLPSFAYKMHQMRARFFPGSGDYTLRSRYAKYPLHCRPRTSDLKVFSQIFVGREYRCLDDVRNASFIVDCGANVGYSSAYFMSAYEDAKLIAIEPDPGNFASLSKNLQPFGARARAIQAAVWPEPAELVFADDTRGEGCEWARSVRVAGAQDTGTIRAVDLATVLNTSGQERISILKIDIEGGETALFARGYEQWLPRVDCLVIELHGPECEAVFHRALSGQGFVISSCDELTVCKRPGLQG